MVVVSSLVRYYLLFVVVPQLLVIRLFRESVLFVLERHATDGDGDSQKQNGLCPVMVDQTPCEHSECTRATGAYAIN